MSSAVFHLVLLFVEKNCVRNGLDDNPECRDGLGFVYDTTQLNRAWSGVGFFLDRVKDLQFFDALKAPLFLLHCWKND